MQNRIVSISISDCGVVWNDLLRNRSMSSAYTGIWCRMCFLLKLALPQSDDFRKTSAFVILSFFMLTFVHYWYQLFISKVPCLNKREIYFRLSLFTHSGEKHGEDVDRSLQEVVASDGDGHGRDKHQVTETE